MNRLTYFLPAVIAISCVVNCGGAVVSVGPPWHPEDAVFFDDGADLIENPTVLAGTWGGRQKNWMEGRVQLADVVAVVEIQTVQTDIEADTANAKRIDVRVVEKLYGTPPGERISLRSLFAASGYALIVRHEKHLAGKFILFYRHFDVQGKGGRKAVGHHFHLSPASVELVDYVKERLSLRKSAEND